jgi:hypothetical protein
MLQAILACITLLSTLITWARERNLMQAGSDQAIAAALSKVLDDVKRADEAGAALDRTLRDPGRLRDHDDDERE